MPFTPLRTDRLVIRQMAAHDADALWERRSDPRVAEYQNWTLPYSREEAERIARGVGEMDGPENDEWWMGVVEEADTGHQIGELALHLEWEGRSGELGYSFVAEQWGKGYAVEACAAFVDHLFDDLGLTRVFGMLHPDNIASAQVLERIGMLFEGHTRSSFWLDGEVSDDWIYGMTIEDRDAWRDRPRELPASLRLEEVTPDNLMDVFALRTHRSQEAFVAPMAKSLAEAYASVTSTGRPYRAWLRAALADDVVAGFVMVAIPNEEGGETEPILWRLLVDRRHQRRGVASMALDLVEDEMRSLGYTEWKTSWIPGRGSPEPFYRGQGWEPTGEMDGREVVAVKAL